MTNDAVSLEAYATVTAAVAAGLRLPRALGHAGVDPGSWGDASRRWQAEIDASAASDLSVLVAFDAALLTARRRFEPTVEPVASDPDAWTRFRRHFLTAADPAAFLKSHGVSFSIYARLEAEWANRAMGEPALAETLQRKLEGPLGDCPKLELVPSPLLADAAPAAPKAPEPPKVAAAGPPRVAVAEPPKVAPAQPSFMKEAARAPAAPPPLVKKLDIRTGSMDASAIRAAAVPFREGDAKPPPASPSQPAAPADLGRTVMVASSPVGAIALPFAKDAGAKDAAAKAASSGPPKRAARSLNETSLDHTGGKGSPMPFQAAPSPTPFKAPAGAATPPQAPVQQPGLSLEYYAALCVELSNDPGRAAQIYPRYRIADALACQAVHTEWQARLRADPALHARWQQLVAHYRALYKR